MILFVDFWCAKVCYSDFKFKGQYMVKIHCIFHFLVQIHAQHEKLIKKKLSDVREATLIRLVSEFNMIDFRVYKYGYFGCTPNLDTSIATSHVDQFVWNFFWSVYGPRSTIWGGNPSKICLKNLFSIVSWAILSPCYLEIFLNIKASRI